MKVLTMPNRHPYYYRLLNPEERCPLQLDGNFMEIDTLETKKRDKYAFPSFSEIVDYFFNDIQQNAITWAAQKNLVANLMPSEVFATALLFARRLGFMEALAVKMWLWMKTGEGMY
jgi:proteasome component ECM29